MEEAKLIRMAAAISEYTVSSMLRETVHSAAESINQAVLSVETLPWIPEHLLSELAKAQQDLARLEQSAVNYQKELAAEVEEAQKALIQDRHFHEKDELGSNLIQRHKLHCVPSLTVYTAVALGRRGIKQVHGSFLRDESAEYQ